MYKFLLPLLLIVFQSSCKVQVPANRLIVTIPTIDQEATSIWRTINDISFLEKQGYQIHLPDDPVIDGLLQKSRSGTFGNEDYPTIFNFLEGGHYQPDDYQKAVDKVVQQTTLINTLIQGVADKKDTWDWTFKMYPTYPVTFTLYGSGGSYNTDEGSITLFTTTQGQFKRYQNPANTIIHEFAHLGMEESIVQHFKLSHPLKEYVVDKFVHLLFEKPLPEYQVQDMGVTMLDRDLNQPTDLKTLNFMLSAAIKSSGN